MAARQIDVLIVVDAAAATSSGDLGSNVYMIDTNKHAGSGGEGGNELFTECQDGQRIKWSVAPVDPDSDVTITGFTSNNVSTPMVPKVCNPAPVQDGSGSWAGTVQSQNTPGNYQYSVELTFNGQETLTFDPFLQVTSS